MFDDAVVELSDGCFHRCLDGSGGRAAQVQVSAVYCCCKAASGTVACCQQVKSWQTTSTFTSTPLVILQDDPVGLCLLDDVHREDRERERQQLAHVRLPVLKELGMPELTMCRGM